jgi:hypothetical protein
MDAFDRQHRVGEAARLVARHDSRRATPAHWQRVALIVARMTGERVGLDAATRMLERDDG